MLKHSRFLSFFFLLSGIFFVVGCGVDESMPTSTAVIPITETPTQTPQPSATFTIRATETAVPTATPSSTPTNIPTETPSPTPSLPSASVLFVRDGALQQWIPQTNEIKILAENIGSWLRHSDDLVTFYRENISADEKIFYVIHLPTQTEYEIFRTSTTPFAIPAYDTLKISANGRWLAYVSAENLEDIPTLFIHEITIEGQQITVSAPVLTIIGPYALLSWATANELSWSDKDGVWMVNLNDAEMEPYIAIEHNGKSYKVGSEDFTKQDEPPMIMYSRYWPREWSSNGRYLLASEDTSQDSGVLHVIDRNTKQSFEIPNAVVGPVPDDVKWLDENTLIHLSTPSKIYIWRTDTEGNLPLSLQKTVQFEEEIWELKDEKLINEHMYFGFDDSLYALNLEAGELVKIATGDAGYSYLRWIPDSQYQFTLEVHSEFIDNEALFPVILTNLHTGTSKEMDEIFGLNSCCWSWYKEE